MFFSVSKNKQFRNYLRIQLSLTVSFLLQIIGGKYGNRLRYVAIVVNTSLTGATLKYNLGRQVYHNWEEYIKQEVNIFLLMLQKYALYV